MVDFKIDNPQGGFEAKFSVGENPSFTKNNVALSSDSVMQLAENTGLVDAIKQVTEEAKQEAENDVKNDDGLSSAEVKQETEEELKFERKRRRELTKVERLEKELHAADKVKSEAAIALAERDAAFLRIRELEVEKEQQKLNLLETESLKAAQYLANAQLSQNPEELLDANRYMAEVSRLKSDTESRYNSYIDNLNVSKNQYDEIYGQSDNNQFDELDEQREDIYYKTSHPLERNEIYHNWLDENPACNPYANEFNIDTVREVSEIKKELNNFLVAKGKQNLIGTDYYYSELDSALGLIQQNRYGNSESFSDVLQSKLNGNQSSSKRVEENMGQPIIGGTPVAPVTNTSGYDRGSSSNLPQLSEEEKRMAAMCPMSEPPKVRGGMPRNLSVEEKYEVYRKNKAKMMGMNV